MRYQKMHTRHLNAVVELENKNYQQPWTLKQFKNCIPNERSRMYVAVDGDVLVGYMILFKENNTWYIENLTVAEENRRNGIASTFIQMAIKVAHPDCVKVLVQDNFLGMHLALKKNGFRATNIESDKDGDCYYAFVSNGQSSIGCSKLDLE